MKITAQARRGTWTPWASVLCVECEHTELKDGPSGQHYKTRLAAVSKMERTEEVTRPDGQLCATCDKCRCQCWVRDDVALLQQVGYETSDLDWEGPFGWALQQTGGMCAALVYTTEDREIVVTAMDGYFYIGEYPLTNPEWDHATRSWKSASFYEGRELKISGLADLVSECAHKVIEFVRSAAPTEEAAVEVSRE